MGDAGGQGSARKCPELALVDLGDVEGFGEIGEENQLYAFQLVDGLYKRTKVTQEGHVSPNFEEFSDVDVRYAVPERVHTLVFTWEKWFPFADPVQQKGWLIDIRCSSSYIVTGRKHKVRKIVNSGTWLCSYVPKTKKHCHFRKLHDKDQQ